MRTREQIEANEEQFLAPYAAHSARTKGRLYPQSPDPLRTDFQRDRDRVIHCSYFRKLEFKTQVFGLIAGDYHRSRLTHTMEVAQIARTLARSLALNEDLAEAIALAHDLGHTPFGHAGEDAMRECMAEHGGFEHNKQGLHVVEFLEQRHPERPGLNLTYEVREGIIKHDTEYDSPDPHPDYQPGKSSSLESQVVDLSDEVAYNNADLDDALQMGLLSEADLEMVPWVAEVFAQARAELPAGTRARFVRYRALAKLYDMYVFDVLNASDKLIEASGVKTIEDVYNHGARLVVFSDPFKKNLSDLKKFLFARVYAHRKTMMQTRKAQHFVHSLFAHYLKHPELLPWKFNIRIGQMGIHAVIRDYVAGMTDRFLMEQYRAAFLPEITR